MSTTALVVSLAVVSVLFAAIAVVFSVALFQKDLCRCRRRSALTGCTRSVQSAGSGCGSGRPASAAAFERLQDAVERYRDHRAVEDGQMLVAVGCEDNIPGDVKAASDDDSV